MSGVNKSLTHNRCGLGLIGWLSLCSTSPFFSFPHVVMGVLSTLAIIFYRDISFLYDVPNPDTSAPRPDKIDKSTVRQDAAEPKKQVGD